MWLERFKKWYNILAMKIPNQKQLKKLGDNLYKKYGQPLEDQHWGEYIAISEAGKIVLGNDLIKVMKKSLAEFGPGSHVFKVGEKAVYKWRRIKP